MLFEPTSGSVVLPLLVFLAVSALAINAAVFVGRRVPNHMVAYPMAMLIGLSLFVLAIVAMSFVQSFLVLAG